MNSLRLTLLVATTLFAAACSSHPTDDAREDGGRILPSADGGPDAERGDSGPGAGDAAPPGCPSEAFPTLSCARGSTCYYNYGCLEWDGGGKTPWGGIEAITCALDGGAFYNEESPCPVGNACPSPVGGPACPDETTCRYDAGECEVGVPATIVLVCGRQSWTTTEVCGDAGGVTQ